MVVRIECVVLDWRARKEEPSTGMKTVRHHQEWQQQRERNMSLLVVPNVEMPFPSCSKMVSVPCQLCQTGNVPYSYPSSLSRLAYETRPWSIEWNPYFPP